MPKLLTAVLTSEDLPRLKRCVKSIIPQTDCMVICNTTNYDYVKEAKHFKFFFVY